MTNVISMCPEVDGGILGSVWVTDEIDVWLLIVVDGALELLLGTVEI